MQKSRPSPKIFFGWYIVAGSVITNSILSAAYFQGLNAFILPIENHFGWSRSVISGAMSLRQLESGIISPIVGFLLDKIKPQTLLFWSAITTGLGLIALGLINGIVSFYIAIFIVSVGTSGMSHAVTWPVVIARWFRKKRGLATGIAVMGPIFGSPFVILNTSLEEVYGWRAIIIGYGVIVLLFLTLISAVARERPEKYGLLPDGDIDESTPTDEVAGTISTSENGMNLRSASRTPEFWLFTGYLSGMFMVNSAFQVHLIPYFVQDVGLTASSSAVIFTLVFTLSGLGRLGAGYMLDIIDYRLVLATVAAFMGISFAYLQLVPVNSILMTAPFIILFGIGFGSIIPMRGTLGSMMFGTRSLGSIVGVLQGGAVAAGVVGPIFMGVIFDLQGEYYLSVWGLVFVCVIMIPLSILMKSPNKLKNQLASVVITNA
ncbi:MAG: hypothetical protein CL763_02915 [Chloroflexi bacterium]|nr:hypothetical protein [Chloroflexota bacterium]|tara:strand:+ start:13965 stop:15260 length:1296 start_codon:yes stop_codon:yes gene_type:complete